MMDKELTVANLANFLRVGRIDNLALSVNQKIVLDLLGPPEAVGNPTSSTETWRYGNLQIDIYNNCVVCIKFQFDFENEPSHTPIIFNELSDYKVVSFADFVSILNNSQIKWELANEFSYSWQRTIRICSSRILISFDEAVLDTICCISADYPS